MSRTTDRISFSEPLEPRHLLAGNFYLAINFQPASVTTSAPGYRTDIGAPYGRRANGMTYGWNVNNASSARQRKSPLSPDQRYDTLTNFASDRSWGAAVPKGTYDVHVVFGDPSYTPSHYGLVVEGVTAIDRDNNQSEHWQEADVTVNVTDGRLTLNPGPGASHNTIDFLEIRSTSAIHTPTDLSWRPSAPYSPFGRAEPAVVQLGNKLYVMGGFTNGYASVSSRVDILNLTTKKWTRGADLPAAETHQGATTDGRYIYVVSGQLGPELSLNSTTAAWKYDPAKNKWTRWINLPEKRYGGSLLYVDHAMHYIGGDKSDRVTATNTHWVLDFDHPEKGWQLAVPLPVATDHAGHVVLNGQIYVFGGEHNHGVGYFQHKNTFRYDPTTGAWTQLADMPTASSHFEGNVVVADGQIWAFGGQVDAQLLTNEVRSYDPATNTWTIHTPLPEKRKAGFAYAKDGVIYVGAGDSYHNGQPVATLVTKLPRATRTQSLALASTFNATPIIPKPTPNNLLDLI